MSGTPKTDKNVPESESGSTPNSNKTPRGGKLARRARSFKEDFLEILSQMRSPGSGGGQRSASPHSPKTRTSHKGTSVDAADGAVDKNPLRDLDLHVKQVQFALKHFRDVISKNKLEVLPGNGTVVLESVTTIHGMLKTYVLNEQSSTLVSATNQVYQSLAKLIKLCDDVLLHGDKALDKENVAEVIQLVEDAVQNLVSLAQDKIATRDSSYKGLHNHHGIHHIGSFTDRRGSSFLMVSNDLPQRSSLPDIPLTPRERQILEQTSLSVLDRHLNHSQSTESILDVNPPPKPPHPNRAYHLSENESQLGDPPPLPPKRRNRTQGQMDNSLNDNSAGNSSLTDTFDSNDKDSGGLITSFDRLSLRSKSPEDTSSLLSASAGSLDSVVSREEEEIQALMDPVDDPVFSTENILSQGPTRLTNGSSCCCWDSSSSTASIEQPPHILAGCDSSTVIPNHHTDPLRKSPLFNTDLPPIAPGSVIGLDSALVKQERLSSTTESGFASMHSLRSSTQSYTASSVSSQQFSSSVSRSSQQSSVSFSSESYQMQQKSSVTEANFVSSSTQNATLSESSSSFTCNQAQSVISTSTVPNCISDSIITDNVSPARQSEIGSPPALPQKTRSRRKHDRQLSQYDNVPGDSIDNVEILQEQHVLSCSIHQGISKSPVHQQSSCRSQEGKPPPLPLKKKHIMAYMEMFGNCSHGNTNEFLRHSVHTYNMLQAEWQQHEMALTSTQSCSFAMVSSHSSQVLPGPMSASPRESMIKAPSPLKEITDQPPALPPKRSRTSSVRSAASPPPPSPPSSAPPHARVSHSTETELNHMREEKKTPLRRLELITPPAVTRKGELKCEEASPLEELDVVRYLVMKKAEEEGPDVRGGHPEALIVHATKANKNDFLYQEAFLTTYRTFISPLDLINKLCYRHRRFSCSSDPVKQRAARESFSLLVRVVSDLTISDLDNTLMQTLMDFVYQLLCSGDLTMAKALRVKIIEKFSAKKLQNAPGASLSSLNVYTRQASLLTFKSEQIAEQMTLLDANLFMKIEIPEVLIWAQEQNEERSPNLTRFTEHFNKMSYWARSRILEQNDAKDRERYVVKFIKIMKHLRKINNFNSYLALLSALDSAPIRRLEWQKHITEGLKEYCALIDSSSSFRAYRQALAETQPPCIPYIGLVLQDLTFVHIGNSDLLSDGSINFSKRWQQFNIVENMKRFKKGTYSFKKHERIIAFFNNFDEFLCEEAMWQISESIKPRGGKKPQS